MKGYLLVLSALLVTSCFSFCGLPWKKHPVPKISVEKAREVKNQFCQAKGADTALFYNEPVILDTFYVFYSKSPSFERAAAEMGIWVDISTGEAFFYKDLEEKKQ